MEDWKIKISVLWLFYAVAFLVVLNLGAFEPGAIEQIMTGEIGGMKITPELMLVLAILMLAPLVMAFLSLTLKDSVNRWANIIIGIIYAVFGFKDLPNYLSYSSAYAALLTFSGNMASLLVVWYAWKSKK